MVVLAASICSRGGKAILSRSFRQIARSRIEALLAAFPKLADTSTQHTTVEQDNVRYVYQPLDELYMVLITNPASNILQDIDTLHLFAQVVTSICRAGSLDEREISRHAFELLSAFDEIITLGYRENLSLSQVKTFLEMESHEERIQMIIEKNKEMEAAEERKKKAKQLELQRREMQKSGRAAAGMNRMQAPSYNSYTPAVRTPVTETIDAYDTEKKKAPAMAPKSKGLQLGKKSKTAGMFDGLPPADESAPLITASSSKPSSASVPDTPSAPTGSGGIKITISETLTCRCTRDGTLTNLEIKGDLGLLISDPSLTKVALNLYTDSSLNPQFKTHPNVDKAAFSNSQSIQLRDQSRGFPVNNSVGVLRWRLATTKDSDSSAFLPIKFEIWTNKSASGSWTVTLEYEKLSTAVLEDVIVTIPYSSGEPTVSSGDAVYEITPDGLEWPIGRVGDENASGSFEFECGGDGDEEFFPMTVRFGMQRPVVDVDVSGVQLLDLGQEVDFAKTVKCGVESYTIE